MSQHFTMELEHEGPAKITVGDPRSGDLYFANCIPYCRRMVDIAARRLGVRSYFDFRVGWEELRRVAETAVYGKPLEAFDEDDPEETDETEARVDAIYYSTGPWFTPAEGMRTADALLSWFADHPSDLDDCRYGAGVPDDLRNFKFALEEAARRNRRFRLHLSY